MSKLLIALALGFSLTAGQAYAQDAAKPADKAAADKASADKAVADKAAADKAAADKAMADKAAADKAAAAAAAAVAATPPPPPAAPPVKRFKMRTLMSQGYEIKAVSFVPQDASSRVSKTLDKDAALITLQKGSAAATCFITLEEYVSPGMADIEWCIEQK